MPLLVHCPQGCQIRVPVNRAGHVVRCSQCKSPIRVARVDADRLASGAVVECDAKLVKPKREKKTLPADVDLHREHEVDSVSGLLAEPHSAPAPAPAPVPASAPRLPAPAPVLLDRIPPLPPVDPPPAGDPLSDAPLSSETSAAVELQSPSSQPSDIPLAARPLAAQEPISIKPVNTKATQWKAPRSSRARTEPATNLDSNGAPLINLDFFESQEEAEAEPKSWQQRLEDANSDRALLARILAICLCLLAIVNVGPAIGYWQNWMAQTDVALLPRWLYLQVFIGSICLVYALFLIQIPDWSALRAVSIAMLVLAFAFGAVSTGLLLGGDGSVAGLLGIPFSLNRQACIWCVAMLCLSTLMSYWAGKESWNWQRAESLLQGILSRSAG